MVETAEELTVLEPGWDGYRGVPVTLDNCNLANRIAEALKKALPEKPQFIPGCGGEIQVEYHGKKYSVEVWIECKDNGIKDGETK